MLSKSGVWTLIDSIGESLNKNGMEHYKNGMENTV